MLQPGGFTPLSVEARDLVCRRGGRLVFAGLSFKLEAGQILAVSGPNGAGKSSLLRVIAGLVRLEGGALRLSGRGGGEPVCHYLGHADALKASLTLRETLAFWAALYQGAEASCVGAASRVGLAHALDLPVGIFSAGQRRRAALARLLLASRPLWLLDEPLATLDRDGELLVGELLQEHRTAGGTAIVATHQNLPATPDAVLELGGA